MWLVCTWALSRLTQNVVHRTSRTDRHSYIAGLYTAWWRNGGYETFELQYEWSGSKTGRRGGDLHLWIYVVGSHVLLFILYFACLFVPFSYLMCICIIYNICFLSFFILQFFLPLSLCSSSCLCLCSELGFVSVPLSSSFIFVFFFIVPFLHLYFFPQGDDVLSVLLNVYLYNL